jgi:hypothetical protein
MATKRMKIVTVALLMEDSDTANMADAVNEMIRPATFDAENSLIHDYAFNLDGNSPKLPLPVPYEMPDDYAEGEFLSAIRKSALRRAVDRD